MKIDIVMQISAAVAVWVLRSESNPGQLVQLGKGRAADFFWRPPTLTIGNFAALWPTYHIFQVWKDRFCSIKVTSFT